ncbi:MAG: FG-GAP repeat domain-containing protein, partial [Opitutaceae bacterium]
MSFVDGRPVVTTTGAVHREFKTRGFDSPVPLVEPARVALVEGRVRDSQWRFADFDGDGRQDLIVGIDYWGDYGWDDAWDAQGRWKNGPLRGQVFVLRHTGTAASPVYAPAEQLKTADGTPIEVFGKPTPNFGDFDGDGDLDLICGEFLDGFTYFQNTGTRSTPRYERGRRLTTAGAPLTLDLCMIVPAACDFDGDGDLDLVVGDEDGRVAFVENTGKVVDGLPQFLPPRYFRQHADAVKFGALSAPVSVDWDGDGLEDLIAGNTAGYLGFIKNLGGNPLRWAAPVYLAAGNQLARELAGPNGSIQGPAEAKWGYTNPAVADWDGDGLPDILTNGIWGRIIFYRNIGSRTEPRLASGQPLEVAWPGATPKPDRTWWT